MPKIQLPVRWSDHKRPSNKKEEEEAFLKRIISGDEDGEDVEFVYGSVVLDTKDIRAYNDLDDSHCILRTYYNDSYCVALGLDELKQVMTEMTGENITVIRKVPAKAEPKVKKPKPPKDDKKDEDDLLL